MSTPIQTRYKIAIISPTPFHYQTQFFRELAQNPAVCLTVFFCSDETRRGADVEKMYRCSGHIMDEEELMTGYPWKLLKNYSPMPSFLKWPLGLINLGVWGEIRRGKFDVVVLQSWTNLTWWLAFFACRRFGVPALFMTDSNVSQEPLKPMWKRRLKKTFLGGYLFRNATGFLTSGRANEKFYKLYGVPPEKMTRLPFSWGYDWLLEKAKELKSQRPLLRKSLGIHEQDFVILYIGRLSREKRPVDLLEAYGEIASSHTKLLFVGDGPLRSRMERLALRYRLPGVQFIGFQPRRALPTYYALADALVLPSGLETWGIVVNEAMCFGLPVIASDQVGASADLIKDGYNGFLFPAGEPGPLADRIKRMIAMSPQERSTFSERTLMAIRQWLRIDMTRNLLEFVAAIKETTSGRSYAGKSFSLFGSQVSS